MKKIISKASWIALFALILIGTLFFAVKTGIKIANGEDNDKRFFTAMVTDGGGINDQSFQQSSWDGMKKFAQDTNSRVGYVECPQTSDFSVNIDKLADENADLIWGIGYKLADTIEVAAKTNPELNYAIADFSYGENTPENVTGVLFRSEESSFAVGYIAALTTKTNSVGFVGGIRGMVIDQFESGFKAGVAYGAKQLGKNVDVKVQYAESFTDSAKGKAIALKLFDDCDVVFHAAGGAGVGVIEAAKETGNFAIGVDLDQSYLAVDNVLTSAVKDVGKAIQIISKKALNGENIGGKTFSFGIKEGCVGIPEKNPNISKEIYEKTKEIENKIAQGKIIPPGTPEECDKFINSLSNIKI